MRQIFLLAVFAMATERIAAQNAAITPDGAATITAADLARHAAVLAHDSLRARAVPSPALERTARYVADQFEQFGLKTRVQRYPVPGRSWLDKARSGVIFTTMPTIRGKKIVDEIGDALEKSVGASFDTAAYFMTSGAAIPTRDWETKRSVVLVAGRHTATSLQSMDLRDAEVLFVPPTGQDSATLASVIEQLRAQSHSLIIMSAADSATFAARLQAARRVPLRCTDDYMREASMASSWAAEVWPAALAEALAAAGMDLAEARAATAPIVRPLPLIRIRLRSRVDSTRLDTTTVPNVVSRIEGTEPDNETFPLVISAHLEHTDLNRGSADSIAGGADGDASEVAGLLVLAQALTRSGVHPRRTVIFLASSGGAPGKDDWGTNYFIDYSWGRVPRIGFNLALERLAQPHGDTLFVAGTQDVQLPQPVAWVAATHPELRLTIAEESAMECPAAGCWLERSAFSRFWIPSFAVNTGHLLTGTTATEISEQDPRLLRNAEREAHALHLVYHLVEELITTRQSLYWNANSRKRRQSQGSEP